MKRTFAPASGTTATPLIRKLGYREGDRALMFGVPETLAGALAFSGFARCTRMGGTAGRWPRTAGRGFDVIHVFATERWRLARALAASRRRLAPAGMIWVSWPKRASKVVTDLTGNVVRTLALGNGLVDVKVCAVDPVWSGLKLVIPLKDWQ